jgi:hypothetical protein
MAENNGLIEYRVDAVELPTRLMPTKSMNLPIQGPDSPERTKNSSAHPVNRSSGTKKITRTNEAKNEDPMLISTPENVSRYLNPMRAIIMDPLYSNADKMARTGANRLFLSIYL